MSRSHERNERGKVPGTGEGERIDRRVFVRTAGGILVSTSLAPYLVGCGSTTPPPAGSGKGNVTITVSGFADGATAAGSIKAKGTSGVNAGKSQTIPLSAPASGVSNGSANVDIGKYDVTYSQPAGYQLASGQKATKTGVSVTDGGTTPLTWKVELTSGTLAAAITGFKAGATDPGTLSAVGTSGADQGQTFDVPLSAPNAGASSGKLSLHVGTFDVTYTPPADHVLLTGEAGTQKGVAITDGGTTNVTWQVEVPTVPGGVVFHSDWSTGSGTGAGAVEDTNQTPHWTSYLADSPPSVVSASGIFTAGFANCFKAVIADNKASSVQIAGQWNQPALGSDLYYRAYLYADMATAEVTCPSGGNHPFSAGPGKDNWALHWGHTNGSDDLYLWWETYGNGTIGTFSCKLGTPLSFRTEYRIEIHCHIVDATTFTAEIRIYDASGTLVRTETDFTQVDIGGGSFTSDRQQGAQGGLAQWQDLAIGFNGASPWPVTMNPANYWGGVCVRTDNWCGAYSGGV